MALDTSYQESVIFLKCELSSDELTRLGKEEIADHTSYYQHEVHQCEIRSCDLRDLVRHLEIIRSELANNPTQELLLIYCKGQSPPNGGSSLLGKACVSRTPRYFLGGKTSAS